MAGEPRRGAPRGGDALQRWAETARVARHALALGGHGERPALATVVDVRGPAYRHAGAKLLVAGNGGVTGGVSGGCLELDVREHARDVVRTGVPRLLRYDARAADAVFGLGAGCGGRVRIFVQPVDDGVRRALGAALALMDAGRALRLATVVAGRGMGTVMVTPADVAADAPAGAPHCTRDGGRLLFVEPLRPPARLIIVGAGDDALPLVALAHGAGFAVTVVDHRPALLEASRFPAGVERRRCRPGEDVADLDDLAIAGDTLVVLHTHSLEHDRAWLAELVARRPRYVGVLGSRRRARLLRRALGAHAAQLPLRCPVGLEIGAEGPEQIAVSIVAELLAVRAGRGAGLVTGTRRAQRLTRR